MVLPPAANQKSLIRHLLSSPPELLLKILEDLTLRQVLELCLSGEPHIHAIALQSFHFGEVLESQETLDKALETYRVWKDAVLTADWDYEGSGWLKSAFGWNLALSGWRVDTSGWGPALSGQPPRLSKVTATMQGDISGIIRSAQELLPLLEAFHPDRDSVFQNKGRLAEWREYKRAQEHLNNVKIAQLQRWEALLLRYPGALKLTFDDSQEFRSLEEHFLHQLRVTMRKLKNDSVFKRHKMGNARMSGKRYFRSACGVPPFTPYDRHLQVFLRVTEKFPVQSNSPDLPETTEPKVKKKRKGLAYRYPDHIAVKISSVQSGLHTFFSSPTPLTVDAKMFRRTETVGRGQDQPAFRSIHCPTVKDCDAGLAPHTEEEMRWVEDFLEVVCGFMMEQMEEVRWNGRESVSKMVRRYLGKGRPSAAWME